MRSVLTAILPDYFDAPTYSDVLVYEEGEYVQVEVHGECAVLLTEMSEVSAALVEVLQYELGMDVAQTQAPACGSKVVQAPALPSPPAAATPEVPPHLPPPAPIPPPLTPPPLAAMPYGPSSGARGWRSVA